MIERHRDQNCGLQIKNLLLVVISCLLLSFAARAEQAARPPLGHLRTASVPAAPIAPAIDGDLDDAGWSKASVADNFWVSSLDMRPSDKTEVLVMSDSTHLYLAFKCYDSMPNKIEALQTRPDRGLGRDDAVTVELDPFLNYSQISRFSVSANGTMSSSIGGGRANQEDWKGQWYAASKRTGFGWVAEISIPYSILNYKQGGDQMGVNFIRFQNRTEEQSYWADITPQFLPEERGRLSNLSPMTKNESGSDWKFLPYLIAGRNIQNRNGDRISSVIDGGLDIRYTPSTDTTAMVSVRPDFSQIQSSVQNIAFSYNQKFAAENRPFFIEGAGYFGGSVYSRLIPDFDYGAKIFGNHGSHSYGALIVQSGVFTSRTDIILQDSYQINPTDSLGFGVAGTVLPRENDYAANFNYSGKTENGLSFEISGVQSAVDGRNANGGTYLASLDYQLGDWTLSSSVNATSRNFYLSNGYVADDSLGTYGEDIGLSYRREFVEGSFRQINASASTYYQQTDSGELQSNGISAFSSVEFRSPQIRLSLSGTAGQYRPCTPSTLLDRYCDAGVFEDFLYDDHTVTTGIAGGTRSSWFSWGVNYTTGMMGGENYEYVSGNVSLRPTDTTFVTVIPEWRPDVSEQQIVINGSWNINSSNTIGLRFILGNVVQGARMVYDWHIRRNLDLFIVASREPHIMIAEGEPNMDNQYSLKLVASY